MKVIGIDPGLAETGVGIIEGIGLKINGYSFGVIRTSKSIPLAERLDKIFSGLAHILQEEKPDLMVVEDVFSLRKNPQSGIVLGKVSGVVLLAGCKADVSVAEVAVREAKQILTGNGTATKEQLEKSVRHAIHRSDPIKPYHASDALALALIGLFRHTT